MRKAFLVAGLLCATAFGGEPANVLAAKSYVLFKAGHERQALALAKKACEANDVLGCREVAMFYSKIYSDHKSNSYIMASTIYDSLTAEKKGCELHDPLSCKIYADTVQSFMKHGLISQVPKVIQGYQDPAVQGMLLGQCADYYNLHVCQKEVPRFIHNVVSLYKGLENPEYDKKVIRYDFKLACYYAKEGFPKFQPLPSTATKEEKDAYNDLIGIGKEKIAKLVYYNGKCL